MHLVDRHRLRVGMAPEPLGHPVAVPPGVGAAERPRRPSAGAAPRPGPSGRPSGAATRRPRGSRTCSGARAPRRGGTAPRRPTSRASAWGAPARPSRSSRRPRSPNAPPAPRSAKDVPAAPSISRGWAPSAATAPRGAPRPPGAGRARPPWAGTSRVAGAHGAAALVLHLDVVARHGRGAREQPGEEAGGRVLELHRLAALGERPDRLRLGAPGADRHARGRHVRAQHPVRIVVVARGQQRDVLLDARDRGRGVPAVLRSRRARPGGRRGAHGSTRRTCIGASAGSRRT